MTKNNSGFSILEVMIGFGMMAILALAFSSMITNQWKEQKNIQAKATMNSLVSNVQAALNNPQTYIDSSNGKLQSNIVNQYQQTFPK